MTPRSRSPQRILFLTVFLDVAGFGMILPLLPFYAQRYGASAFQVGLLFASYSLAQAVFAPVLGRLSDRHGRRPVLIAALAANTGALLLLAAADSFAWILVARIASGMAAGNFSIAQAYVADVTPPAERSRGMGLIGAALGLGFVCGPALGGLLALLGQSAVPLGAAALTALDLLLVALLLPESRAAAAAPTAVAPRPGWRGLRAAARPVSGLLGLFFVVVVAFSVMEATLALFCAARFGFGVAETSAFLVGIGLVLAGVQGGAVGPLVRRWGERRLVPLGIALMCAGLLALAAASHLLALGLAGALLAAGSGLHQPALLGLISQATPGARQGGVLGLSRSLQALARTVGPLAGGWVFDHGGPSWPFLAAAALMAAAFPFALRVVARARPPAAVAAEAA